MTDEDLHTPPLTNLSEEEELLRANVQIFAKKEVSPLVRQMDETASIPRDLIEQLFSLVLITLSDYVDYFREFINSQR